MFPSIVQFHCDRALSYSIQVLRYRGWMAEARQRGDKASVAYWDRYCAEAEGRMIASANRLFEKLTNTY